ncbi:transcriptional regulator, partial [Paenibacillus jamilae]
MDDILDIRSLSRVNKELKAMDRYFESIQKRARNFRLNSFQRQKIVIDQTTESVKRLSNALSNLTSRLYKINRLTRNFSGIKIAVKCSCSKDCSKCRSTCHSKMGSSNGVNHSLTNLQKKITSQLGLQNKVNINKSSAPGVPLKTRTSNSPSKSVNSQSPATKNTEKEKIVVIKPVMNTMAFIKKFSKVNDAVESLNKTVKAYRAITPSQVAAMPSWLQTAKTKIDDVVNRIKTSTIYTQAASMYSGAPSWVKTGLKGAGKIAKSAIVVADIVYDASEILNATGEKKYKLIGEFVGSKIGNIVGKSVGGATVAIPYVGPVIAPIASLVLGAAGEWLGGKGGGKIMEKVWYAKTHLKGWTKSLNEGIDTTTKDFKQSMNGFNNEVANKTNNIKTTAPATIDSWSNKIVNFIGNKGESAIGIVENITGKV